MGERAEPLQDWRERVLSDPDLILDDRDVMRALITANDRQMGGNIVDMRGIAMERLENRLDRLEDTHRSVIAAAYENLAGTNQVHRAILKLLEQRDFEAFLKVLGTDVAAILRVDRIRLVLESAEASADAAPKVQKLEDVLTVVSPGFVDHYLTGGRNIPDRAVTLRQVGDGSDRIYGEAADWIASEALLKLDLGHGRLPALLVIGSEDPHQFRPSQGTDLLSFFTGVFERSMKRFLG
ncbi:MAG: recombinase XerC [Nioella sp.]|nr:recombinase XerC [Nioella sp.]|tara:strand:+ start:341 stop:1054 length:714 start_codon:yes stop_codon:yes gene_type:complete